MKPVTIYTTAWCPYCYRAKALLAAKGAPFEEIDVTMDAKLRADMEATAAIPCRRSGSARRMWAAATICTRWSRRAGSTRCWRARR